MRNIIPHKLLINFNGLGEFREGILMYQVRLDSGELLKDYKTISINSTMPHTAVINEILKKAIKFAKEKENERGQF